MIYVIYTIHVVVCLFLILVVLLQQGKGADLSVFGGGSTQTAFGARGAATLLHKLTTGSFVFFILTTLAIAVFQGRSHEGSSVMSGAAQQELPLGEDLSETAGEAPAEGPAAGAVEEAEDGGPAGGETQEPQAGGEGDGGAGEPQG